MQVELSFMCLHFPVPGMMKCVTMQCGMFVEQHGCMSPAVTRVMMSGLLLQTATGGDNQQMADIPYI